MADRLKADAALSGTDRYIESVRGAFGQALREPQALISGSLLFWLCTIPILTYGNAMAASIKYQRDRLDGVGSGVRDALRAGFRTYGVRAFLMGLTDLLAVVLMGGCLLVMLGETPMGMQLFYGVLMYLDLLYLLGGRIRYTMMVADAEAKLGRCIAQGTLLALHNMGWLLLYGCIDLLLLMIGVATGIGLLLLFPALEALLFICAYRGIRKRYVPDEATNEATDV